MSRVLLEVDESDSNNKKYIVSKIEGIRRYYETFPYTNEGYKLALRVAKQLGIL